MNNTDRHDKKVIEQFTAQSARFSSGKYLPGNTEYLKWFVERMPLKESDRVIDVAAGTGLLSFAVSPYVKSVTAVDITEAMLEQGRKAAAEKGATNVTFIKGSAYDLREEGTYDAAICRFAFHHLEKPEEAFNEMVKAVRPGGLVAVIDMIAPGDEKHAEVSTRIEQLRDDSHVRALTKGELEEMFRAHGLSDLGIERLEVVNDLENWMEMAETPEVNRAEIRRILRSDISGVTATGSRPFREDGRIKFRYSWAMFTGRKQG